MVKKTLVVLLILTFLINGCATAPSYRKIFEKEDSYNSKEYFVAKDILHQATLRTMYSRNFIIEEEDEEKGFILAKRAFQRGKKTFILALQSRIISSEDNKCKLYLSAIQTTEKFFVADRTRFFLFIIPLPGGGGKEATRIKEGEKMIEDRKFYQKIFSAVEDEIRILVESRETESAEGVSQEKGSGF